MSVNTAGSDGRIQPARPGDPSRIGPYRIIGRLGAGGMGTVHAGLTPSGQRVAVKVIHPAQAEDPEFRARFRREVHLSARVQGPCLVPLLAADPEADEPWLATAYAPGPTVNQHVAGHGPLIGGTLYAFATGTAQAMAAIHLAGVVHRDVKPQNVILTPAGPRVLDFGIARAADGTSVTRTGVTTGTPGWISPEYYRTGTAGPEGDMFAWGALVAYAATGRLPFGSGAPDVVAFRVLSDEPDLEGVPAELRKILERALAKDPSDRISAATAETACAELLASQATLLVEGDRRLEPTRVGDLLTAEWNMPTLDDPTWHAPSTSPRRRTLATVLVAAAAVGGLAGAALALPGGGDSDGGDSDGPGRTRPVRSATGAAPEATSADTAVREDGTADEAEAAPTGATADLPADPRAAVVPADPLAGVPDPAFTRAGESAEPNSDEWRASTAAASPEERTAEKAIRDQMASILATKDMDFMTPTVTFNRRAQTVMVTGGPVSQIPEDHQEMFRRAGDVAACSALAVRLKNSPTTWPYGRFVVSWKNFDGDLEPNILGFGEATDGCYSLIAGQWRGDESGLAAAGIPSGDKDEIRVADAADKAITAAWNDRIAEGHGLDPFAAGITIDLGFDPVEKAAYVWARDTDGALIGRAQQSHFQDVAATTVCQELRAEYTSNRTWNYTRWTAALYEANSRVPQLLASGTCSP
ncbi:serine/threonine-protein kinase [Streptomyces sp. NPDC058417]|uniref:serine/threonine-protein kinase n=1 Tax=unclassified Streptomyces TaxID=2593676 RepID=UPI00364693D5